VHGLWDIRFLLGILNSSATNFYFRQRFPGNNHIASKQLATIPVPSSTKDEQAQIAGLVERMLDLHKKLAKAKTAHQKTVIQRQIDATDRQIDALVYDLYGLTKKEIAIIEEQT